MTSVHVANTVAAPTSCPACGAALVSERGAVPWCERCAWGIDVYEPPPTANWWQRRIGALSHRLAYRLTMRQFRELASGTMPYSRELASGTTPYSRELASGSAPVVAVVDRPRTWTRARLAVIGLALVLYLLIAAVAGAGIWLVQFRFPNPALVPGVLLLLIAAYLIPRPDRLPRHAEVLSRDEAPSLYALVDRAAAAIGTRPPRVIVVEPWFSASTAVVGWRRRRVLTLGLALWGALSPGQRVALLGHELGHFGNGDARRGLFVQPALTTLGRLSDLFRARTNIRYRRRSLVGPLQPLVDLVMRAISSVLYLAHLAVLAVALRDGQRAEYRADQQAARLAGSQSTVELLDLMLTRARSVIASRARAQGTEREWRAAAVESLASQAPARIRLRQLSSRSEASLWASHPPTGLRAWLVEGAAWQDPTFVLTDEESDRCDAELARRYQSARRDLAQSAI